MNKHILTFTLLWNKCHYNRRFTDNYHPEKWKAFLTGLQGVHYFLITWHSSPQPHPLFPDNVSFFAPASLFPYIWTQYSAAIIPNMMYVCTYLNVSLKWNISKKLNSAVTFKSLLLLLLLYGGGGIVVKCLAILPWYLTLCCFRAD